MSNSKGLGRLSVISPGAEIEILDAFLRAIPGARGIDRIEIDLPAGAYCLSAKLAGSHSTQGVLVDADQANEVFLPVNFDAAAPVVGSGTRNESHGWLAGMLTRPTGPVQDTQSQLVIMLRGLNGREMGPLIDKPEVVDPNGNVAELEITMEDPNQRGPRAIGWRLSLPPGGYRLRWRHGRARRIEHAIWLAKNLTTIIFVPQGRDGPVPTGMSVQTVEPHTSWNEFSETSRDVEVAIARLRSAPSGPDPERWKRLLKPGESAMLTLLTLHEMARIIVMDETAPALLESHLKNISEATNWLHDVLGDAPDLLALTGVMRGGHFEKMQPVPFPPMLANSMSLLLAANRFDDGVIPPGSLTSTVSGQRFGSAPWLVWEEFETNEGPASLGSTAFAESQPLELALGKVLEVLSSATPRLGPSLSATADQLGIDEIARRAGMTSILAKSITADLARLLSERFYEAPTNDYW